MTNATVRVSRAVVVHVDVPLGATKPTFVLDHLARTTRYAPPSAALIRVLMEVADFIPCDALVERLARHGMSRARATRFVEEGIATGLLEVTGTGTASPWDETPVGRLLLARAEQPYLDYRRAASTDAERALMASYAEEGAPPAITKPPRPGASPIALACGDTPPTHDPSELEWLGQTLWHAFGVLGCFEDPDQGVRLRKTHPSGGARHPLEAYVGATGVRGLEDGVYQYAVADHALARIDTALDPAEFSRMALGADTPTRVTFLLTATPERVMWRYREPSSYLVMMLDAGHALEGFAHCCRCDGLDHFVGYPNQADALGRALALPSLREIPLCALGVRA